MCLLHVLGVVVHIQSFLVQLLEALPHLFELHSNTGVVGEAQGRILLVQRWSIANAVFKALAVPVDKV